MREEDPDLQTTREGCQIRCKKATPDSTKEGSSPLLPATGRPCHDADFPKGEVGVDGLRCLLLV